MATKRKDKSRVVLKTGEVQRKDGTYQFSWQDSQMKRRFVYARTSCLRRQHHFDQVASGINVLSPMLSQTTGITSDSLMR